MCSNGQNSALNTSVYGGGKRTCAPEQLIITHNFSTDTLVNFNVEPFLYKDDIIDITENKLMFKLKFFSGK